MSSDGERGAGKRALKGSLSPTRVEKLRDTAGPKALAMATAWGLAIVRLIVTAQYLDGAAGRVNLN